MGLGRKSIVYSHVPASPLRHAVASIWICEAPDLPALVERVLPSGVMSIHVSLAEDELRWYPESDPSRRVRLGGAAVMGAFAEPFGIDTAEQRAVLGVELAPALGHALLGCPVSEIAGTHVSLDALWGSAAALLRERLLAAPTPRAKLAAAEAALRERLPAGARPDPLLRFAASRLAHPSATVREVAALAGTTPRRLRRRFAEHVGLRPKLYARVRRFQRVLASLDGGDSAAWAERALACGFYDQPHLNHDFRAFTGMSPRAYLRRRRLGNHVPLDGAFLQDGPASRG